nr:MAG TPA: Monocytic leukemia zinc finger protein finger, acetyl transferase, DNA [Bacteriophage sp.]
MRDKPLQCEGCPYFIDVIIEDRAKYVDCNLDEEDCL